MYLPLWTNHNVATHDGIGNRSIGVLFFNSLLSAKGPVKLINPAGENSSFIFTVCIKAVPLYRFKFAYAGSKYVYQGIFRNPLLEMEKWTVLIDLYL